MSATDDLRKMLDERGVEWTSERVSDGVLFTFAKDCHTYSVFARDRAGLEVWSKYLTPEQVITATLGPKTCHNESEYPQMFFICSECGCAHKRNRAYVDMPRFCPNCGARVVEVGE